MNILGLSRIQQQTQIEKKQQQRLYLSKPTENDSFQKSNNITFKANPQKIAQEILKDAKLSQKFMSLLAMGAATLIATAHGHKTTSSSEGETEIDNGFGDLFAGIVAQENETEVDELQKYKDEVKKCKEEIASLKKEIAEQQNIRKQTLKDIFPETDTQKDNLVGVAFPKKRGRLSKEETNLKQIVETLQVSPETATKLNSICNTLLNSKTEDNKDYDTNLKSLAENLTSLKETPEALEKYIGEYSTNTTTATLEKSTDETEAVDVIVDNCSKPQIAQPKVIAKIDLEKIEPHRRQRIHTTDPNKDFGNTELKAFDDSNEIFTFKIPGTPDSNVKNNLTRLLLRYESHLAEADPNNKPKWMHARPISPKVSKLHIKREIALRNQGDSKYKNITENDAEILVNLINSEKRFSEYFTLHSSLRLIDRFVNFNSEIPVEIQTQEIIDKLLTAIQKGLSDGIVIENYVDQAYKANGARLIINSDPKTNPEAFDISGSYDLILGICENQPDPKFYNTRNKTPLICTIFANGI